MRQVLRFACEGEVLLATLDGGEDGVGGDRRAGLLIVSGGNEIRCGAHRGMARLAGQVAGHGYPVFRYDRRGVGDSSGDNGGFLAGAADLAAAVAAFRSAQPHLIHVVGFGNCDGASTLALFGRSAGIDRLLLANPWVVATADDLPPAAAIRAHYADRLRDPAAWRRLLSGGIDLRKAIRGLGKVAAPAPRAALTTRILAAITDWGADARILLAQRDATAIAFRDAAPGMTATTIATASHSFAGEEDQAALLAAVLATLEDPCPPGIAR